MLEGVGEKICCFGSGSIEIRKRAAVEPHSLQWGMKDPTAHGLSSYMMAECFEEGACYSDDA